MIRLVALALLIATSALAQQPSSEQTLRQINAYLSQENARLGAENEQLKQRVMELMKPPAKDADKK